jgi:methionyl-tRNA formyltransferase
MSASRAVVFAYHDVGVRCLKVLLSAKVEVPLVVTVRDDPQENRWFASVADTAREYGLPAVMPDDAGDAGLAERVAQLAPDFIFSFYYRSMLGEPILRSARLGALNMHGSLLPKYRGRAPVNWAILNGEPQTGATLHYMVARADAGDIIDQLAVPILEDDDAREVFGKVTAAAEIVLARSLPGLIAGTAPRRPQLIEPGQYFGRRRPEDGRIDWSQPAVRIHNLVRAVAPPFPGAFTEVDGRQWRIHRTRVEPRIIMPSQRARLFGAQGACYAACSDGGVLRVLAAATADGPVDLGRMSHELEARPAVLG